MATAPLEPQSSPARRLLRALSFPLPPSLPSRTPTPRPDSAVEVELDDLDWSDRSARPAEQDTDDFQHHHHHHQQQPPSRLRRRQTTATATTPQEDDTTTSHRLPWPVQSVAASYISPHRRSIESCFSDASSLSTLSESEPRATHARPKRPRIKTRKAESEAIWREHWI